MAIKLHGAPLTWRALVTAAALGALLAAPAQANLVGSVTLSLIAPGGLVTGTVNGDVFDPTPISLSQVVTDFGTVIDATKAGSVAGFMLPNDSISFSGNSILLHIAAGTQLGNGNVVTGLLGLGGAHARYVFDGLALDTGTIASANTGSATGASGAGGQFTAPGRYEFYLDELVFTQLPNVGTGDLVGVFSINLVPSTVQPPNPNVPEPASAALVLLALAALRLVPRGRCA